MNSTHSHFASGSPAASGAESDRAPRRYHGLDFVRASMMMLGVVLHTALVFLPEGWIYLDPQDSPVAFFLVDVIHIFRMPVFFVMAGFFGAMLFERKGVGSFSLHRFDRIVIPLVVGWFVLFPMLSWSISFAWTYASLPADEGSIGVAFRQMSLDADFSEAGPMHLWFLYYLIYYYVAFALLTMFFKHLARPLVRLFRFCISELATGKARWLRLPVLVVLTTPLMLTMDQPGIDTPETFVPVWRILALYAIYFGVGWVVYEHREVVSQLEAWAWLRLLLAALFLAAVLVFTIIYKTSMNDWKAGPPFIALDQLFALIQLLEVISVWLLVLALTGVCERLFRSEWRSVRYMVDASYWIYLMHLPLTLFIPALFRNWDIDGTVKMFVMMVLVTVPLLITYHFLVRGTALGVVLNGRRYPVWSFIRRRPSPPSLME